MNRATALLILSEADNVDPSPYLPGPSHIEYAVNLCEDGLFKRCQVKGFSLTDSGKRTLALYRDGG